jgi:hypothetical protein
MPEIKSVTRTLSGMFWIMVVAYLMVVVYLAGDARSLVGKLLSAVPAARRAMRV